MARAERQDGCDLRSTRQAAAAQCLEGPFLIFFAATQSAPSTPASGFGAHRGDINCPLFDTAAMKTSPGRAPAAIYLQNRMPINNGNAV